LARGYKKCARLEEFELEATLDSRQTIKRSRNATSLTFGNAGPNCHEGINSGERGFYYPGDKKVMCAGLLHSS